MTDLDTALRRLGLAFDIIAPVRMAPGPTVARGEWDKVMPYLRKAYKKKAFELHPDRGGDPKAFHRLQEAWDFLSDEHIAVKIWDAYQLRPVQQVVMRVYVHGFTQTSSTATTSTVTPDFGGVGFGVPAFIRRT